MAGTDTHHTLTKGGVTLSYRLVRRPRKTIKISVDPDGSVEVAAPPEVPLQKIEQAIERRIAWIIKQKNYFASFPPPQPPRQYVGGETHRYLGRQYRLKLEQATVFQVKLDGGFIIIRTPKKDDPASISRQLDRWYRNQALPYFQQILDEWHTHLSRDGIPKPILKLKQMKNRWGSCNHQKKELYLNPNLIKAPSHAIHYVIVHELIHLKHPRHDRAFYDFLTQTMPDWKTRKHRLESTALF